MLVETGQVAPFFDDAIWARLELWVKLAFETGWQPWYLRGGVSACLSHFRVVAALITPHSFF